MLATDGWAAARVQLAALGDLSLGQWPGRGPLTADDWHCVRVQGGPPPHSFRLEAYGTGPGGRFVLENGEALLPFSLAYDDGRGLRAFAGPGRGLGGLEGSRNGGAFRRCLKGDAGERRRLRVEVAEPDLARAPAGRYRGTLLLMVVPE